MKLERIVTLANATVKLRFVAMERSLRAVGCDLPLFVIPYDDRRFELPGNAQWWDAPEVTAWLTCQGAHPTMRKYQCLLVSNYQFVDADVCFLRDPTNVLAPLDGFVTSCGHWHNPAETTTASSRSALAARSTTWRKTVFNSGQFACDRALYDLPGLMARAESPIFSPTCLKHPFHEQPGLNMLVHASEVPVRNLTLPPWDMQSTWAGDYPSEYRHYWPTEAATPYLIHWAGTPMYVPRPIHDIFLGYLSAAERSEWSEQVADARKLHEAGRRSWRARARRLRNAWRAIRGE